MVIGEAIGEVIGEVMSETSGTYPGSEDSSEESSTASLNVFDFTPQELQLNRSGHLSQRQRDRLQQTAGGMVKASRSNAVIGLAFLPFGLCLILALYLQNADSRAALFSSPLNLLMLAGTAVLVLVIVGLGIWWTRRQSKSLASARLEMTQGPVRLDRDYSPRSGITGYLVYVGKERFAFVDDMSALFHEGKDYRVYFVHAGPYRMIMSFEERRS